MAVTMDRVIPLAERWLRAPKVRTMRVPLMGVVKRLQATRLASQLAFMLIEYIRRDAITRYGAQRVMVFGSLAWGGFHAQSDVDLAVDRFHPNDLGYELMAIPYAKALGLFP